MSIFDFFKVILSVLHWVYRHKNFIMGIVRHAFEVALSVSQRKNLSVIRIRLRIEAEYLLKIFSANRYIRRYRDNSWGTQCTPLPRKPTGTVLPILRFADMALASRRER